jgi:hypothetical protein
VHGGADTGDHGTVIKCSSMHGAPLNLTEQRVRSNAGHNFRGKQKTICAIRDSRREERDTSLNLLLTLW